MFYEEETNSWSNSMICLPFLIFFLVFWSKQATLLLIVGELVGTVSVAMVVDVSDK